MYSDSEIRDETRSRSNDERVVRFSTRPRRPPAHLSDYVLDANSDNELLTTMSEASIGSVISGLSSTSSRLSDRQSAKLEEVKRKHELDELKAQLEEDRQIKVDIQNMEELANTSRLALQSLERQIKTEREIRTEKIFRDRKLREAERKYKEAKLVSSMIDNEELIDNYTHTDRDKDQTFPMEFDRHNEVHDEMLNFHTDRLNTAGQRKHTVPKIEHDNFDYNVRLNPHADTFTPVSDNNLPPTNHPNHARYQHQPTTDIHNTSMPVNAMLVSSVYGIPKPTLPEFRSGKERDFNLLKMAFQNLVDVHPHLTESYKYQLLLDKLGDKPKRLAESFMFHSTPYTQAMQELSHTYGSTNQLVQSEINDLLTTPPLRFGDYDAFERFALRVQSLVGMLKYMPDKSELNCASHVSTLLAKLPYGLRENFTEYCIKRGLYSSTSNSTYNLLHFDEWLQLKSRAKRLSHQVMPKTDSSKPDRRLPRSTKQPSREVLSNYLTTQISSDKKPMVNFKSRGYCPKCRSNDHFLNTCQEFQKLSDQDIKSWLHDRCFRCARRHKPEQCNLKTPCQLCKELHLTALHSACHNMTNNKVLFVNATQEPTDVFLDQPSKPFATMLKVVPVTLYGPDKTLDAYAILDDGSQRTMILDKAAKSLDLAGHPDNVLLTTIRCEPYLCTGQSVNLQISARDMPDTRYNIVNAFTSNTLSLSEYTYPVSALQQNWSHLRDLPLHDISNVRPVILIGSDLAELIVPQEPVRCGPSGSPIAVHTKLGWTLQGTHNLQHHTTSQTVLFTQAETTNLLHAVQRLWKMDTLPYVKKDVIRSKQDKLAVHILDTDTCRVEVNGVNRYATPLLRFDDTVFQASKQDMLPTLKRMEQCLLKYPEKATIHSDLAQKLVDANLVKIISNEEDRKTSESWYIPHHVVEHNNKHRLVFNCSYELDGKNLNKKLLAGPPLGPSLLGVFVRFRQHRVAIAGDIKGMFHQVRLLPRDRPLLRFLWRDMRCHGNPDVYEWQVLPFGTTCSPVCATYALQKHVKDNRFGNEHVERSVMESFYVDNCLDSLPDEGDAKDLLQDISSLLDEGGFHVRQWCSNVPSVVEDVKPEDRSSSCEMWLNFDDNDQSEGALGLLWYINSDEIGYKQRLVEYPSLTLRVVYRILAGQYDPIGFLAPYLSIAKCIVQDLWAIKRDWDATIEQGALFDRWTAWESQLPSISEVKLPRCYASMSANESCTSRELHIFCDASERTYGAAAYLRTELENNIQVNFVQARCRIAPKRQLSVPRLELCAALIGAQLADLLSTELTVQIQRIILWSDSTTVLTWLKSESCRYKVFVGTRVAEIQTLTEPCQWRYINTSLNPADDLKGKTLQEICCDQSQWRNGPPFLKSASDQWPERSPHDAEDTSEVKTRCLFSIVKTDFPVDPKSCLDWNDLVSKTMQVHHGAALNATDRTDTEMHLYSLAQQESFPDDFAALQSGEPVPLNSRLLPLDPVYDSINKVIRVGGRLVRAEDLPGDVKHPIVLDPKHVITRFLIKDFDDRLKHYGPERILAEMRRSFWIIHGRQAIRKHQHSCKTCQKWRGKPEVPKMSSLPPARLQLFKPPFYSTGIDCFGPMTVTVGRRSEKRWGIIYKCMTTRAVHLDLVDKMDTDSFLMSLRRFISRRGQPREIWSDRGTNFRGGHKELEEAWADMKSSLKDQLVKYKISFNFNPPSAPHFGGLWEREIKCVKDGLKVTLGNQSVTEPVLQTVLAEIEGILNSKPLGYVSSDVRDIDPVTPNVLLMGRRDSSLPQVVYPANEIIGRRRWRHSQILVDHFWKHFLRRYLPDLQVRGKWTSDKVNQRDLKMNDVVMIIDPQSVRANWLVGRVSQTHHGSDGRVRVATVTVGDQDITRPVSRLIRLPECEDD